MGEILHIKGKTIGRGKPLVCVPVMAKEKDEILEQVAGLADKKAQMVEWRVDAFLEAENPDAVQGVLEELKPLVQETVLVYTFRSGEQGGMKSLPKERMDEIHRIGACAQAVDFVDIEFFREEFPEKKISALRAMGAYVIASHHDFAETPETAVMSGFLEQMDRSGADVVKLAVMPRQAGDVLRLLQVTEKFHRENPDTPLITMSMGSLGVVSRISGETFGSCVTFGAGNRSSAPGQLPMEELEQVLGILHGVR